MEGVKNPIIRSISDRLWVDPVHICGATALRAFCDNLNITMGMGRILAARNLLDEDKAYRFLNPDARQLHGPFLMRGMRKAVGRIVHAIQEYQRILVVGDYDVDGTASATILYSYLKRLGARVQYHIPHRVHDGYGFNSGTVRKIKEWKIDLVVSTDLGSTDVAGAARLKREGVDLIITDHHTVGTTEPAAVAMINPRHPECAYPFKDLAAAGVVYKLICALDEHLEERDFWNRHGLCHTAPPYFLDLVAMATVADMSPLLGENRILVKLGLDLLNARPRPGLQGLIKECRIHEPVTPSVISFRLAPKINALGRVGDPRMGMQLLLSHSLTESRRLARFLMEANRIRQEVERDAFGHAMRQVEAQPHRAVLVLIGQNWHPGVVGTIATRIAAQTRKPTVALTLRDAPPITGSARSTAEYNVLRLLDACGHLLQRYGGHANAAGLAVDPANLESFVECFHTLAEQGVAGPLPPGAEQLEIEAWIEHEGLTKAFFRDIDLLSPFGYRNPEPLLGVRGLLVRNPNVLHNRHLRFSLHGRNGHEMDGFVRDHAEWNVHCSRHYDIAFMPHSYEGPDGPRTQLRVVDLKNAES